MSKNLMDAMILLKTAPLVANFQSVVIVHCTIKDDAETIMTEALRLSENTPTPTSDLDLKTFVKESLVWAIDRLASSPAVKDEPLVMFDIEKFERVGKALADMAAVVVSCVLENDDTKDDTRLEKLFAQFPHHEVNDPIEKYISRPGRKAWILKFAKTALAMIDPKTSM